MNSIINKITCNYLIYFPQIKQSYHALPKELFKSNISIGNVYKYNPIVYERLYQYGEPSENIGNG